MRFAWLTGVGKGGAAIAVGAVLVATAGTAVAATGGALVLGRVNSETHVTTIVNSDGVPLSLQASADRPPLRVSNSNKVARLNADLLDGRSAGWFQRHLSGSCTRGTAVTGVDTSGAFICGEMVPARVIIVSDTGSAAANGAEFAAALSAAASYTTAASPSTVRLGPGLFDIGATPLSVPDGVQISGAGPDLTTIEAEAEPGTDDGAMTVSHRAWLRDLTLTVTGVPGSGSPSGSTYATGVLVDGRATAAFLTVTDVDISVTGADDDVDIMALNGQVVVDNAHLAAITTSTQYAKAVTLSDSGLSARVLVRNGSVTAEGPSGSLAVVSAGASDGATVIFVGSQVDSLPPTGQSVTCVNDYDDNFVPIANGSC